MAKRAKTNNTRLLGFFILLIITAAVALTVILVQKQQNIQQHAASADPGPCHPYGDVDRNNTVDVTDALKILRHVAGLPLSSLFFSDDADVNADGQINSADALKIQRYTAGLDKDFQICKVPAPSYLTAVPFCNSSKQLVVNFKWTGVKNASPINYQLEVLKSPWAYGPDASGAKPSSIDLAEGHKLLPSNSTSFTWSIYSGLDSLGPATQIWKLTPSNSSTYHWRLKALYANSNYKTSAFIYPPNSIEPQGASFTTPNCSGTPKTTPTPAK